MIELRTHSAEDGPREAVKDFNSFVFRICLQLICGDFMEKAKAQGGVHVRLGLLCSSLASASIRAGRTMVTDIPCLAQISDFSVDSVEEKGKNNHRKQWDGFHSLISSIIPITKLGEDGSS